MDKPIESISAPRVAADGMGGDGAGDHASVGVEEIARKLWKLPPWREQPSAILLEALCQQSHEELCRRGRRLPTGEPHSSVIALLIRANHLYWAHRADLRLYCF